MNKSFSYPCEHQESTNAIGEAEKVSVNDELSIKLSGHDGDIVKYLKDKERLIASEVNQTSCQIDIIRKKLS